MEKHYEHVRETKYSHLSKPRYTQKDKPTKIYFPKQFTDSDLSEGARIAQCLQLETTSDLRQVFEEKHSWSEANNVDYVKFSSNTT